MATAAPDDILEQTVIVRFDASTEKGMPWQFKPQQHEMTVRIGENALAFYEAYNPTDRAVAGTGFAPLPIATQARIVGLLSNFKTPSGQTIPVVGDFGTNARATAP